MFKGKRNQAVRRTFRRFSATLIARNYAADALLTRTRGGACRYTADGDGLRNKSDFPDAVEVDEFSVATEPGQEQAAACAAGLVLWPSGS